MQRFRQPLDNVALPCGSDSAGLSAEAAADGFAQCLGAIDDEQAADLGVEPARDEICQ